MTEIEPSGEGQFSRREMLEATKKELADDPEAVYAKWDGIVRKKLVEDLRGRQDEVDEPYKRHYEEKIAAIKSGQPIQRSVIAVDAMARIFNDLAREGKVIWGSSDDDMGYYDELRRRLFVPSHHTDTEKYTGLDF